MKNNKFILGLILGVFLIGLISALSVTGYLTTREGVLKSSEGYTATLQGVQRDIATIKVTTPGGATEIVEVQEGRTAMVEKATISATGLTRDRWFRGGGAEIKIEVVPASGGGAGVIGTSTVHTHLYDYANSNPDVVNMNSNIFQRSSPHIVSTDILCNGGGFPLNVGFMISTRTLLSVDRLPMIQSAFLNEFGGYSVSFYDPDQVIVPSNSSIFVYCAQLEQAVNANTPHFPFY